MSDLVVGVDVGGTNTAIGLVTNEGKVLAETTISTRNHSSFEEYIQITSNTIKDLLNQLDQEHTLIGIGVGAPNGSNRLGGINNATNIEWKGFLPLADEFSKHFNLPVRVINDAKAAALGEFRFGAGVGMQSFIMITLGTGLGGGIIVNGEVLLGHDEQASELGHTVVKTDGRKCGCGKQGCLETYVSATGISRTAIKLIADHNGRSSLANLPFSEITAKRIAEAANEGDPVALDAFNYTGKILGIKLADFVAILNPEAIIITGGLAKAGDLIFEPIRKYMEKYLFNAYKGKVKVLPSGLDGLNAGVIGAAVLIWQQYDSKS